MRLFKNLSTFVVGALLATSAAGAAIRGDNARSVEKRAVIQKRGLACEVAAEALGRRLRAREDVDQGGLGKGNGDDDFETHGLSDCIGLAVTIDLPEGAEGNDRWLLHYEAEEGDKLEELKEEVEAAKAAGGTNIQVKVVHTDPETQVPALRESLQGDIDKVLEVASGLLGSTPDPVVHPLNEGYSLYISSDKSIPDPESEGEWMSDKWKELYEKEMNGEEVDPEEYEDAADD